MQYRIYSPEGADLGIIEADSADAALLAYVTDLGYQVGDLQREADCNAKRSAIDAAKAAFAAKTGMVGASNSAVTRAWKAAGSPQ